MLSKREYRNALFKYWLYSILIVIIYAGIPLLLAYFLQPWFAFREAFPLTFFGIIIISAVIGFDKIVDLFSGCYSIMKKYREQG